MKEKKNSKDKYMIVMHGDAVGRTIAYSCDGDRKALRFALLEFVYERMKYVKNVSGKYPSFGMDMETGDSMSIHYADDDTYVEWEIVPVVDMEYGLTDDGENQ